MPISKLSHPMIQHRRSLPRPLSPCLIPSTLSFHSSTRSHSTATLSLFKIHVFLTYILFSSPLSLKDLRYLPPPQRCMHRSYSLADYCPVTAESRKKRKANQSISIFFASIYRNEKKLTKRRKARTNTDSKNLGRTP